MTLGHAIQRLMVLDAIVKNPEMVWLATAEEKAVHLTALTRIEPAHLPHVTVGQRDKRAVRYFRERLPIGIHLAGRGILIYVVTEPILDHFRAFLQRHAALLRALPAWTLRIVVPPHIPHAAELADDAVRSQLLTPLPDEVVDEMRWYFEQARAHPSPCRSDELDERFFRARTAFAAARFKVLYRLWKQEGDAVVDEVRSPALANAVATGSGRIEVLSAGHRYLHLSPLVNIA